MNNIFQLIENAELKLWFMSGSGLGAAMLCLIAIAFIFRPIRKNSGLTSIIRLIGNHFTSKNGPSE